MSNSDVPKTASAPGDATPGRFARGFSQVLRDAASVCAEVDPSTRHEWIVKRMQFFAYDVASLIPSDEPIRERLARLNFWFFGQKRFQAIAVNSSLLERVTLHTVLAKRVGSPLSIGLLYAYLAQHAGIDLEFANARPAGYLKFFERGFWRYVDLMREGKILEGDELLELLQSRFRGRVSGWRAAAGLGASGAASDDLLETVPHERIVIDYLESLRAALRGRESAEPLLVVQNWLLALQPANFQELGERAILHLRLGHHKSALSDLKRYFSFMSRDRAPAELLRAFDELSALFAKGRGASLQPAPVDSTHP
jgi:regulator of sirC expression with transglutaminase-like and TPR domain